MGLVPIIIEVAWLLVSNEVAVEFVYQLSLRSWTSFEKRVLVLRW